MNKIEETIRKMIVLGFIPETAGFDITENIIQQYIKTYSDRSITNAKYDAMYARKLAGLNLLKLNLTRGYDTKSGIVYMISNSTWKDKIKIGMTLDLPSRLLHYQTYDPYRRFKVNHYEFVLNRRRTEKLLLKTFKIHGDLGEWVSVDDSTKIIKAVRSNAFIA